MRSPLPLLFLLAALGCRASLEDGKDDLDTDVVDTDVVVLDVDGDGITDDQDCNDTDATVFPGAPELCDGLDNDCDEAVDEDATDATTWYPDLDGDGVGDDTGAVLACDAPAEHTGAGGDCDDTQATVFPGAEELCNGLDDDCDGDLDEEATDTLTWYADTDGDGFGDEATVLTACEAPPGTSANADDCDDTLASVRPDADELCNEVDDDCDGTVDEDALDAGTWYADTDGDGFGDEAVAIVACNQPAATSADRTDCDDAQDDAFPGNTERCNGFDDDCDTLVDEPDAADASTWYADLDGDGVGDSDDAQQACDAPTDRVADDGDCDDLVASVYPGAPELCDGLDNDCSGTVDDGDVEGTWYRDEDEDGVGTDDEVLSACAQPDGYVAASGDCDDLDPLTRPGADEDCDPADRDCDGAPFADAVDASTWYLDADRDGAGGELSTAIACTAPANHVATATDCDDLDATTFPGADELCDGADNDCDGSVDEDPSDPLTWYFDTDGDGFGDANSGTSACRRPAGTVANDDDCDDTSSAARPGGTEVCDELDNDCDGSVDTGAVDAPAWYADTDEDGFGDPSSLVRACDPPEGFGAEAGDCDDTEPLAWTGNPEVCDGVDNDCSGDADSDAIDLRSWYADTDDDGRGDPASVVEACEPPADRVGNASDCNDSEPLAWTGNPEVCDGVDNDCSGDADSDAVDRPTWYPDLDADGRGDTAAAVRACEAPPSHIALPGDCDDGDALAWTGAIELCDGSDNDCNGTVDDDALDALVFYADSDGDGFGDADVTLEACAPSAGFVEDATDCDDDDGTVRPSASELCNGIDDDCDGVADDGRLGEDVTCAAVSCAEVIADRPGSPDGTYWLDPDGSGPVEYSCDMTSDSGGWTQVGHWNRVDDGDTYQDLADAYTLLFDSMGILENQPGFFRWYDGNESSDALAYGLDVVIPNGGEVRMEVEFTGRSMEHSGIWWFVEDELGDFTNIACADDDTISCNNNGACDYGADELAWRPYDCGTINQGDWNLDFIDTYQTSAPAPITVFNFWTLMDASTGDDARLYKLNMWVR